MIELPNCDLNSEEKTDLLSNVYIDDLIKDISIFILSKDLISSFYNFSDYFLKHRIDNDELKHLLKDRIIEMLQKKDYKIAYVFNKTGLVICENEEEMEKSIWKSNLDFIRL
jgi:hypothetical protein